MPHQGDEYGQSAEREKRERETITPALTAEEWVEPWDLTLPRYAVDSVRHEVAARCLYQQPFGFDASDVSLLESEARSALHASHWCPPGYVYGTADVISNEELRERAERLRSLASRIAALLPPTEQEDET